jgi:hypothetical protein
MWKERRKHGILGFSCEVDLLASLAPRADEGVCETTNEGVCPSAFVSEFGQRGASPLRAGVLRPVTESYCVTARWGGELLEVNDWSVTRVLTDVPR